MNQTEGTITPCIVTPTKDIVASYLAEFQKELQSVLAQGCREVVIDLKNVEIVDSRGLAVFMLCHNSLSRLGGHLKLVTQNEDLRHVFRVMRTDKHITITDQV